jgi:toxin secretion/phage lysis holin
MTNNTLTDTYEYLYYILVISFKPSVCKFFFSIFFVGFSFAFDVNQHSSLLALFILILLDFITGISAAKYVGEPIRSSKIKHTAIKMTAYFVIIAGSHLAEKGLVSYLAVIDETVVAFFLLTELISLLENMGRLGIQTPKKLLNQLVDTQKKL